MLDAAALDLEAYPGWLRAPVSALVLNRLAALYCDEMSYAMGHPISSRRYMGVEKILMKLLGIGDNVLDDYRWRQELYPGGNSVNVPVLARRYDGSTAAYIGVLADDGARAAFPPCGRKAWISAACV